MIGNMLDGQLSYVMDFTGNWISIVNNTTNPIVLFLFNTEIRASLKNLFQKEERILYLSPQQQDQVRARRASSIKIPINAVMLAT